ncbi:MAG: cobalt-precorrin-6A reductase [Rhodospirillales bacterium]|nr:cobalt-precorrin-6A reductase [Rhodospirillales bacterium]
MTERPLKLLILGGTAEGRALAHALHAVDPALHVVTSLAGVTKHVADLAPDLAGEVRIGGFGGTGGLVTYIKDNAIDALIDATHPFARHITENAVHACAQTGTPYLRLDRPEWPMPKDTDVVFVPDAQEAARLVARTSRATLLTIGNKDLAAFEGVDKVKLVVRVIEQPGPELKLNNATYVVARPPFTLQGEVALIRAHGIDTVVTKASGGDATRAKLDAAAAVGARLVVLRRPPAPTAERVFTIEDALVWTQRHLNI